MHVGCALVDKLCEQAALCQGFVDPLLQVRIELLKGLLGVAPLGNILEQNRKLPALRRLDAKGTY
ncbi:hypothetical protein D3C76_1798670 [compost metagenome]